MRVTIKRPVRRYIATQKWVVDWESRTVEMGQSSRKWPLWAIALKALAIPEDKGAGDTIARVIGPIGGDAFKAWRKSIGKPCKCPDRQEKLNRLFPYK